MEERLKVIEPRTRVAERTEVESPPSPPPPAPPSLRLHLDQVAQATKTEALQENADHFLAVYEQEWEWGVQARELEEEQIERPKMLSILGR